MVKGRHFFSFFFLVILFSQTNLVFSDDPPPGFNPDDQLGGDAFTDNPEQLSNDLAEGGTSTHTLTQPQPAEFPSGEEGTVEGTVEVEEGSIKYADSLQYSSGNFIGVRQFRETDNGYTIEEAEQVEQNNNFITNGRGITFENEIFTADYAETFLKSGSISSNLFNLTSRPNTFSVDQADSVLSGCVTIDNVSNSTFTIYNNGIEISTPSNEDVHINDCSFQESTFNSNDGRVIISKDNPPKVFMENGNLTIEDEEFIEIVEAENISKVELDPVFGVKCAFISPEGTYWYKDKSIPIRDFAVRVPNQSSEYKLCIKKDPSQRFTNYSGLVDFTKDEIKLNGIITYLRLPFEITNRQTYEYFFLDFNFLPVYLGFDPKNQVVMTLDKDFLFVDNFSLINANPTTEGIFSYVNHGSNAVYEHNREEIKRYQRFNENPMPTIIKNYNSYFGKITPSIYFKDDILIQEGINDVGTVSKVQAFCKDCPGHEDFEADMKARAEFYPIGDGNCGASEVV